MNFGHRPCFNVGVQIFIDLSCGQMPYFIDICITVDDLKNMKKYIQIIELFFVFIKIKNEMKFLI